MSAKKVIPLVGLLVVGISILSFCFSTDTLASSDNPNNIGKAFIIPSSPLYSFKIIKEDWERKFAPTLNTQIKRELEFSSRRIREVKSLIDENQGSLIATTLERYRYNLQQVDGMSMGDKKLRQDVIDVVMHHPDLLIDLHKQSKTKEGKRAILTAIERIQKYLTSKSEGLELPINMRSTLSEKEEVNCGFIHEQLLTAGFNDAEKAILGEMVTDCLKKFPKHDASQH